MPRKSAKARVCPHHLLLSGSLKQPRQNQHIAYSVERAAHKALTNHRINNNREFFKITVAQAAGKIEDLAYQMQATADSAIRHAIEEDERIKRAQAIQREAAERYQREAPQREAAERARREAAELARVERDRAEAEQA